MSVRGHATEDKGHHYSKENADRHGSHICSQFSERRTGLLCLELRSRILRLYEQNLSWIYLQGKRRIYREHISTFKFLRFDWIFRQRHHLHCRFNQKSSDQFFMAQSSDGGFYSQRRRRHVYERQENHESCHPCVTDVYNLHIPRRRKLIMYAVFSSGVQRQRTAQIHSRFNVGSVYGFRRNKLFG